MNDREFRSSTNSQVSAHAAVTGDDRLPRIVILVAGEQSCVETAVRNARQLYPDRHFVFVCEPAHCTWLLKRPGERVFIVEQPFNPFGHGAAELRESLEAAPIEACALVIADAGFESFRFRVFALRLRPKRFLLLHGATRGVSKQISRSAFTLLAGAAPFLGRLRKIERRTLFYLCSFAAWLGELPDRIPRAYKRMGRSTVRGGGIRRLPVAIGGGILASLRAIGWRGLALLARLLPPFDQPLAVGLAWLARIRSLFGSSPKRTGNELVHVIPSIGMGGVQRQLVLLLKNRSPAYNHRVVVLRSDDRFFAPELSECGVGVCYLDSEEVRSALALSSGQETACGTHPLLKTVTSSLPFCSEIIKLSLFLRSLNPRPDLVHCWLLYANLAGSIAARLAKMPRVVTSVRNIQSEVNYNYYDPRWQRALERATVPLANAITANAPAVAADYKAFAGARPEQVVTVLNGIDVKTIDRLTPAQRAEKRLTFGLGPKDLVVGTVARLAKEKDFETFLRAVALARGELPALRSMIIGGGPLRAHLESFAASLGLVNFVQFLGERKDIGGLIQCFDVFLLTSVIEGMPNAAMESQLLGVPVVATRAGGSVDLIRDGETGLLAPIGDDQALASCIVRLFTEDGLWGRISLAAAKQIREGYTIEQLVARTETVYRDLLDPNVKRIRVPCAE
jgi:glycosyltransferase involved in cell wall biosynthesis